MKDVPNRSAPIVEETGNKLSLHPDAGSHPHPIIATPAQVLLPVIIGDFNNADSIIDEAIADLRRLKKVLSFLQQRGKAAAYDTVGRLYVISMRAKTDDDFRARLMQRATIRVRRDT